VGKPLKVAGETVKVAAFGYDPRRDDPHADAMPPIDTGLVPPPYQLLLHDRSSGPKVVLSRERLNLGRFPQRALHTELLVLRNLSETETVEFRWERSHPLVSSGLVSIEPLSGVLEPKGFQPIKLLVNAACAPCIVENQIAVHCRTVHHHSSESEKHLSRKKHSRQSHSGGSSMMGENLPQTAASGATAAVGSQGGGGTIVSASTGGAAGQRDTIVARQTVSRQAMLNGAAPHIKKLTGRMPSLPSRPPPPPRMGDEDEAAAATTSGSGGSGSGGTGVMAATAPVGTAGTVSFDAATHAHGSAHTAAAVGSPRRRACT